MTRVLGLSLALAAALTPAAGSAQNVARRDGVVAIHQPDYPAAARPAVNAYRACLNEALMGKPLTPTPDAAFARGIESCVDVRADAEAAARQVISPDWSDPGTAARATQVKRLFDDLDESERMAARAIAAQFAQMAGATNAKQEDDAQNH